MKNPIIAPELHELLVSGDTGVLRDFCNGTQPALVAELIGSLPQDELWQVIRYAEPLTRAEIFSHLDEDVQLALSESLSREDLVRLFTHMPPDDRADLYRRMPEERRDLILPALAHAEREDIRRLAAYKEGTAGAAMTSDYATLPPNLTAFEAIEHLRVVAPDKETIYYAYVVDAQRRLLGYVSLKDLIVARREQRVEQIMHRDLITAKVEEDQEVAARRIQKYDLLALPVTNGGDALVGIITHDDAIDIITQEQTEDIEKLMAISGRHEARVYLRTSVWQHFKNRAVWVSALAVLGLVSGFIVQSFEGVLMQFAILAVFMPMLADTGGNTGSQASSLVVRALALGEIKPVDALRVVAKEARIGLMLGLLLGGIAYGRVLFMGGGSTLPAGFELTQVGFAIALALSLQVVSATVLGALLPLGVAATGRDPAVIASPALTTVVDISGLMIYFFTARAVLGL